MTTATELAAKLNAYTGDNWAQDLTYGPIDEAATVAAGYDPDRMGDPNQIAVCTDGSRITYSGGAWVAVTA